MLNIRAFHAVALGDSHKENSIPCQDAAQSFEDSGKGVYIAAVSDGHGGKRHLMSEYGSTILVTITVDLIRSFVDESESGQLAVPFSKSEVLKPNDAIPSNTLNLSENKPLNRDKPIEGLISSIISNWNIAIEKHWVENQPSREYMLDRNVPEESINDYLNGINIEYAYGCTLIAFVRTPHYWLAIQIGDGNCIAFNPSAEPYHPIPDDLRFSGSTTASICDEDAIESFRYCYGNTNIPVAVFLGSDGIIGYFGTVDEMTNPQLERFYETLIKSFVKNGYENTVREIEKILPILSSRGATRDDMSLAGVLDISGLNTLYPLIV
ncbi:MAG: protein phosphatase 2C domain-containing protein [Bacteroidales bacterium]|nr:protein phosphatase 2C domain-containing protein [Bacteroidales bacterium]